MERDPSNRYATAREFVHDLEHQDQVGVAERAELHEWKDAQDRHVEDDSEVRGD